ncbi:MotE family protein [Lachnospira pectinoschiza]|uniref:Flagellar motility protein MotE, a chaperone for MotC folding n=1 Tax=Lachnospira pectinoschiza TaxID=28052 RepID=A0A1G9ZA57_9FIRM|nr:hypothetical protein [Lachnospira pectinoschiza]SDN17506.1 Flagellar motility protein MotE, a chaperone for MotC folding [Lachnospira pectinoschiza]
MAKKKSKDEIEDELQNEDEEKEKEGGILAKLGSIFIALIVIAIWLAIFALLIKMNVGGIGSMLRPYLKNVPGINMILPEGSDEETAKETGSSYKTLAEALDRINELEAQIEEYENNGQTEKISELEAEVARLKVFEENAEYYQQLKDKFDTEVVYTDNAPDIENYKSWYESIDADNAAKIYEQVIKDLAYSEAVKEWASTFGSMEAANAAAILEEMTGDTDLVADILLNLDTEVRAAIMAEMDTVFAAKLTKVMYP